ncbi:hypothetical protein CHS0354_011584 [Potamilus streckersoni]|uniref:Uncharacterized protein n=1 Tax=Potamilus streckersoni TaxID=2493646 RepID=A0AAE0RRC1_9BIVA|nr:hypothetical protein CHS0354_011584 [Potamilus streckersoni]
MQSQRFLFAISGESVEPKWEGILLVTEFRLWIYYACSRKVQEAAELVLRNYDES